MEFHVSCYLLCAEGIPRCDMPGEDMKDKNGRRRPRRNKPHMVNPIENRCLTIRDEDTDVELEVSKPCKNPSSEQPECD